MIPFPSEATSLFRERTLLEWLRSFPLTQSIRTNHNHPDVSVSKAERLDQILDAIDTSRILIGINTMHLDELAVFLLMHVLSHCRVPFHRQGC